VLQRVEEWRQQRKARASEKLAGPAPL
jgi:hypothetical protein